MRDNRISFSAETLGAASFRERYKTKYAYVSGSMYKGVASKELVVRMGKAGLMSFFGSGGLSMQAVEADIQFIAKQLTGGQSFGVNLLSNPEFPAVEDRTVDLLLRNNIHYVEASAFVNITPAIIRYRLLGLSRDENGVIQSSNNILAKISRPEVASAFLNPAPEKLVSQLLAENKISQEQAELAKDVPVATDICMEADSGGHTDMGIVTVQAPTIKRMVTDICASRGYKQIVHFGIAGGIGTPEAAAAMFVLGADFILTGSINQCTVESGNSDDVKNLLQEINIQDTDYAPAGDMFEIGAKVQVMKRGSFFPARGNKLYDLWKQFNSLEEIDERTRKQIQEKYFRRSFDEVYSETKEYYLRVAPEEIEKAERNPKHKMALIFRWYFIHCGRMARAGDEAERVNYQVHTGPAIGAFNQWVKGTALESWNNRHVDQIGIKIMHDTAAYLQEHFS